MAGGFKKKLPVSAALRPGGFGTVPPAKPAVGAKGLSTTKGMGAGMPGLKVPVADKAETAPKAPTFTGGTTSSSKMLPQMPKMPKFR